MESVPALQDIIKPQDLMVKIYLKGAYVVVPMHSDSMDFLSFEGQGIVYRSKSLLFDLSVSPRVFSKIMKYAAELSRQESEEQVRRHMPTTCQKQTQKCHESSKGGENT